MDSGSSAVITPQDLYAQLGTRLAPVVVDVRRQAAFDASDALIVSAVHHEPADVAGWRQDLPAGRQVVVYCVHGHEVSQDAAEALRRNRVDAVYLEGGMSGWEALGLPQRRKVATSGTWVTRERPKIDRIACPWLIRRFFDPNATFLYVPTDQVFAVARDQGATAYDIPGAEPFSHVGELCSFDSILKVYGISDAAMDRLALIVRGADTGRPNLTPVSAGLLAISLGLSANFSDDDHAMLDVGMHVYDALYAWCRSLQHEAHNWNPAAV